MKQTALALDLPALSAARLPKVEYDFPAAGADWNGIALIGEAPGAEEAKQGHPFVGRSGQLLDKMLGQAGIDRRRSFIGNVFRYQPPKNKIDHFFTSRRAAKEAGIAIAEQYGQFGSAWVRGDYAGEIDNLSVALVKLKPRIIIALGRTPTWALTGTNGLLDKVGKRMECRLCSGVEVIPTYHPSFIMRGNWGLQEAWLGHFVAAKEKL